MQTAPAPDASAHFRQPQAVDADFALVTDDRFAKPVAFDNLSALARRVHRDRGNDGLRLEPANVRFRDRNRDVVAIYAEDEAGGRHRLIGHAWIGGRPWTSLRAALERLVPLKAFGRG